MEQENKPKKFPWGWLAAGLLAALLLLGGAWLAGRSLGGETRRRVSEPEEIDGELELYGYTARDTAAPAQPLPVPESIPMPESVPANTENSELSNRTVGWGQGVEVNEQNQPTGALIGQEKYGPLGGRFIFPDAGKTVYLTFDLGYENGYTAPILDALKEKGVRGVFFVTMDYVKSAPELVQRIIDEGHVLGNHSVHHPSMPGCTPQEAAEEVMGLHRYVKENFGYAMHLFRFPRGEFSERRLAQVRDLGYSSIFWSCAYVDWKTDDQPDVSSSLARLTKAAHPGAIYLLHTVSSTNASLMGDLIGALQAEGYKIGLLNG